MQSKNNDKLYSEHSRLKVALRDYLSWAGDITLQISGQRISLADLLNEQCRGIKDISRQIRAMQAFSGYLRRAGTHLTKG